MSETKNHRTNNWKHAKREKRIYYQLLKEDNADTKRIEDLEHFNFKKTNALKKNTVVVVMGVFAHGAKECNIKEEKSREK